MKKLIALVFGLLMAGTALAQIKVVYHLSEGIPQASRAIGNIRNHLMGCCRCCVLDRFSNCRRYQS